jgi:SAM-dependent methyltransferase
MFKERVFVGHAIDIGSGPDPLKTDDAFPLLKTVREWDQEKGHGDATYMADMPALGFDLVYSSHCLEHITSPLRALARWWDLVRVGGHLVVVVPDEELYERNQWPPRYNSDHKNMYSTAIREVSMPDVVYARHLEIQCDGGRAISLLRLEDGFDPDSNRDQTADGSCECGIELVIRKERA